jgi:hypothetical protein
MKLQVTLTNGTVTKTYEAPIVLYYVGHAGQLHVDYSNGAAIRNDETYRAARSSRACGRRSRSSSNRPRRSYATSGRGRQDAAERAAAEQARIRD